MKRFINISSLYSEFRLQGHSRQSHCVLVAVMTFSWLLGVPFGLCGQETSKTKLSGRVIDDSTHAGVVNANIFIANSMIGTSSDSSGRFELGNLPPGSYDLVASCVGYFMSTTRIQVEIGKGIEIIISLRPRLIELGVVEITARKSEEREEELGTFRKLLLGSTPEADECLLINPYVLQLSTDQGGQLTARADSMLIIDNLALGYRLHLILGVLKLGEGCITTAYKSRFEELQPSSPTQQTDWEKKRASCYSGSLRHFLVSLTKGDMAKQGFAAYESRKRVVSPTDHLPALNESDIVTSNGRGGWAVWFNGFLVVDYFLEQRDWSFDAGHEKGGVYLRKRPKSSVVSMEQVRVLVDSRGQILTEFPFRISGDWAKEGLARELPLEYTLPKKE